MGGSCVWGQCGPHTEFQTSLKYITRPYPQKWVYIRTGTNTYIRCDINVILALRRMRKENCELKAKLGYKIRHCLKIQIKKNKQRDNQQQRI
jgi:hypothetical protein